MTSAAEAALEDKVLIAALKALRHPRPEDGRLAVPPGGEARLSIV